MNPAANSSADISVNCGFRDCEIKNVDAADAEIPKAPVELIGEIAGRHTMAPRGDVFRAKHSAFDDSREKYSFGSMGIFRVGRKKNGLRAKNHLVAKKTSG